MNAPRNDEATRSARRDLRNREPKFSNRARQEPKRPPRRALRLVTVLRVLGVIVLLAILWETLPDECKTTEREVARYCVD